MNDGQSPVKGPQHILIGSQLRSRHCSAPVSGQGTPRSKVSTLPYTASCISSRDSFSLRMVSVTYDGDMSEMDGSATTFSDSGVVTRMMPHFWLIMYINVNHVDLLFQHSDDDNNNDDDDDDISVDDADDDVDDTDDDDDNNNDDDHDDDITVDDDVVDDDEKRKFCETPVVCRILKLRDVTRKLLCTYLEQIFTPYITLALQ
ncbi:hypothetical protein ACF0H5_021444 [Mactra antiquata]